MKKTTSKKTQLATPAAFESCVNSIADMITVRDKQQAKLDAAILAARDKFGPGIVDLQKQIEGKMAMAELYARDHRDTLMPRKGKTSDTTKARFGFRLGNAVLSLASRKINLKAVISTIIEKGLNHLLVFSEPKLNKEQIKKEMTEAELADLGLTLKQKESFWVEPKTDSAERLTSTQ